MTGHLSPEKAYKRVTDQQRLAAEPGASAWVSANVGSGKTKVLIDRVARLLLSGAQPDSILCITYTKAAASEMQQRLFKRLGGWSVMPDKTLARDLSELQDITISESDSEALKTARALFAKALETPGGLRIETLHAFAGRVLRRFPLEAGVPPGFSELDELEGGRLWENASRRALLKSFEDPAQVEDFRSLIREIGGLGRKGIVKLLRDKAGALSDFTGKYPDRDDRLRALGSALGAPDVSLTAFLRRVMTDDLPHSRIERTIDLYLNAGGPSNEKQAACLRDVLSLKSPDAAFEAYAAFYLTTTGSVRKSFYTKALEGSLVEDMFHPQTGEETQRILAALEALSALRLRDRTASLLTIGGPVLNEYRHDKRLQAGLDFDDLIVETRRLLTSQGLAEWVLYKLDGQISHILLDEAQDTSPDQWQIVNALVSEFFSGANAADRVRTLFVVGDEKQSIYSFQGADTAKFQAERRQFAVRTSDNEDAPAFHLPEIEMSFRTVPQVLNFVDTVFNGMADAGRVPFSTEAPSEADRIIHHAFRHEQNGRVEVWPLEEPDEAKTGIAWDAPMDMEREISPARQLAEKIAVWIAARLESDEGVWCETPRGAVRPVNAGDILILVRTRGPLFHAIIQALKGAGLPVAGADRVNLLDTLAVQDLLNLIRFALCPEDDLALAEILKGPFIGLLDDDAHLFPLAYNRENASVWSRLQASNTEPHRQATQFLETVLVRRHLPAFEFLDTLLSQALTHEGLTGWQLIDRRFGHPARDPIEALLGIAGGMDDADAGNLQLFLHAIETADSDIKRELSGPSGDIRVMTIHGAKGLEAPIVILPDTTGLPKDRLTGSVVLTEEGVPVWLESGKQECAVATAIREREKARLAAEQNRLLYVALTRARDHLVICGAWGKTSKTGYLEGSWYQTCEAATSAFEGARRENNVWVLGDLPKLGAGFIRGTDKARPLPLPDWISKPVTIRAGDGQQRAPSQLLPGDTPVLPPFGKQHLTRFRRGRLIHELLEILPELPHAAREDRARRFLSRCLDASEQTLADDVMKTAFEVLNHPDLSEVFGPGGRAEAPIVGTGPNLPPGLVINGRIDRMRVTETEVLVIDYKTDRPPPKHEADVALPYLAQMGSYFDVLSSTYPDKTIKCALLWTDGPRFMILSESAMLGALTKARAGV